MTRPGFAALSLFLSISLLSATAFAQKMPPPPEGTWIGGEGMDQFEGKIEFDATGGTFSPIGGSPGGEGSMRFEMTPGVPPTYQLKAKGENETATLLVTGSHRMFLLPADDDEYVQLVRVSDVPKALRGKWTWEEPGGDEVGVLELRPQRISVRDEDGEERLEGIAYGLPQSTGTYSIAFAEGRGMGETVCVAAGRGAFLLFPRGDDEYIVIYRAGKRPAWLPWKKSDGGGAGPDPGQPLPQP